LCDIVLAGTKLAIHHAVELVNQVMAASASGGHHKIAPYHGPLVPEFIDHPSRPVRST